MKKCIIYKQWVLIPLFFNSVKFWSSGRQPFMGYLSALCSAQTRIKVKYNSVCELALPTGSQTSFWWALQQGTAHNAPPRLVFAGHWGGNHSKYSLAGRQTWEMKQSSHSSIWN